VRVPTCLHIRKELAHAGEGIGRQHVHEFHLGQCYKRSDAPRDKATEPAKSGMVGHQAQRQ
jgi:hypothetical protein